MDPVASCRWGRPLRVHGQTQTADDGVVHGGGPGREHGGEPSPPFAAACGEPAGQPCLDALDEVRGDRRRAAEAYQVQVAEQDADVGGFPPSPSAGETSTPPRGVHGVWDVVGRQVSKGDPGAGE
ncbi:hypothetical protein [Frankia sp. Cas3]|uniref:hypothetical protein n=1 Tax=Frankia sp. Cas3 TaxID=3073926 RepID=UPI002AD48870|nr:hypothetical protein [Frankia sp. Cas3]